jgi:hypothetical protein
MRVLERSAEHKAQNAFYLFIYPTSSLRDAVLCCNWWHDGRKVLVAGAAALLSINSVSVRANEGVRPRSLLANINTPFLKANICTAAAE